MTQPFLSDRPPNKVDIYVDAAFVLEKRFGIVVYLAFVNERPGKYVYYVDRGQYDNNKAEESALYKFANYFLNKLDRHHISFYSDSQYAIDKVNTLIKPNIYISFHHVSRIANRANQYIYLVQQDLRNKIKNAFKRSYNEVLNVGQFIEVEIGGEPNNAA